MSITTSYREIPEDIHRNVNVDMLTVGTRLPFDVYIKTSGVFRHLFKRGTIYTPYADEVLREKGGMEFYIERKDDAELEVYLSRSGRKEVYSDDDPKIFQEYSFEKEQYYQVDRNVLIPGTAVNFSLYVLNNLNFSILAEGSPEDPVQITMEHLAARGDILIMKSDLPLYSFYMNSLMGTGQGRAEEGEPRIKAIILRENSKLVVKDLLEDPRSGRNIKTSTLMVNKMIDTILKNSETLYDMIEIRNYDYYTYTHSVNVSVMSIGLGAAIGLPRPDLEKLAIGCILHDIGKSVIPHEILNKQGKLSYIEYQIMKTHVYEGEKLLRGQKEVPEESFSALLQHHEKLTGGGYPGGLARNDISLFGRIASIVDCYDALTTQRPYKTSYTPYYSLSLLVKEKESYDCSIMKEFVEMLGKVR